MRCWVPWWFAIVAVHSVGQKPLSDRRSECLKCEGVKVGRNHFVDMSATPAFGANSVVATGVGESVGDRAEASVSQVAGISALQVCITRTRVVVSLGGRES